MRDSLGSLSCLVERVSGVSGLCFVSCFLYFNVALLKMTDSLPFPCAICRKLRWLSDSLSPSTGLPSWVLFFPGFLYTIFLCHLLASHFMWQRRHLGIQLLIVVCLLPAHLWFLGLAATHINFFSRMASSHLIYSFRFQYWVQI